MRCRMSTRNLCLHWKRRDPTEWFQEAQRAGMNRKLGDRDQGISCLIKKFDLSSNESPAVPQAEVCALCVLRLWLSCSVLTFCPHRLLLSVTAASSAGIKECQAHWCWEWYFPLNRELKINHLMIIFYLVACRYLGVLCCGCTDSCEVIQPHMG